MSLERTNVHASNRAAGILAATASLLCGCGEGTSAVDLGSEVDLSHYLNQGEPYSRHQFVTSRVVLPVRHTDFAIDLNGDGQVDNQFGDLVSALAAQGFNPQAQVDEAVIAGTSPMLSLVKTIDPTLQNDAQESMTVYRGQAFSSCNSPVFPDAGVSADVCPKYDGTGLFAQASPTDVGSIVYGSSTGGSYNSNNPVTTTHPVELSLYLSLFGGEPIELPLNGTNISYAASVSGPMIRLAGAIHGSISSSDLYSRVIPSIATLLSEQIAADPASENAARIESAFDSGGCTDADGGTAKSGDGIIDACEILTSPSLGAILVPDVQVFQQSMYDADAAFGSMVIDGHAYGPNKNNAVKDSFSVAVGFEAVEASF